ncbi:subtilisin-like protease SBT5.4 [Malania oleifera]|uniref:subtilisin-like protease SBT5.4 n=1 Tax=Malania oleifera TaxID=397392 RepID=UPI0025AEAE52|nr:subtilisin-like protease SBT5.4 [Malania oleifera]
MRLPALLPPLILQILLFLSLQNPTLADKKAYIVYLGTQSDTRSAASIVAKAHKNFLGNDLESEAVAQDSIFYSYTHLNGFAAMLDEDEAERIRGDPDVASVFPNNGRKLHTTRSWDFLGLEKDGEVPPLSIWKKARFGEDAIIGNIDTGVWPESKSFNDEGMGPIPTRWKGFCQNSFTGSKVTCNRKLIGARYFNKGYAAYAGKLNSTFETARDEEGHGSHTLSTAGGNFVPGASVFGHGNGTAKGGSPKARVAAYKACWPPVDGNECFDADILAAFDASISDGVDVLSVSLGGDPVDYSNDGISIGAFHAFRKGVTVVCSAGNSGPFDGSVSNVSPWILTVGASTMDREFSSYVTLGNKKKLKGVSLSEKNLPANKMYPVVLGSQAASGNASLLDAMLCNEGTLKAEVVKGKILVCERGETSRVAKGQQAARAGAVAMVLVNDYQSGNELIADPHVLPASHLSFLDGQTLISYVNSTKNPMANVSPVKTVEGVKPSPVMASFSSKGPNFITPEILKPDITAPGVSVIAAFTQAQAPSELDDDKRRIPFNAQSGTSMSCPHVAGVVGLIKTLHPTWSPAAIKSAIMTSARTRDNSVQPILNSSNVRATPFSYGAGHVRPNRAMDPGLVYDLTTNDHLNFLCALGYSRTQLELFAPGTYRCPRSVSLRDFNYPSITVPDLNGTASVTRKVKNVGSPGTYTARVQLPAGIAVSVKPERLEFGKIGEEKSFKVTLKAKGAGVSEGYVFGELTWSDGKHYVKSPIVVARV